MNDIDTNDLFNEIRKMFGKDGNTEEDPIEILGKMMGKDVAEVMQREVAHEVVDRYAEYGCTLFLVLHREEFEDWARNYYVPVIQRHIAHGSKGSSRVIQHVIADLPGRMTLKDEAVKDDTQRWAKLVGGDANG